ncbi:MAG: acyltransferase family protein [Acidimicrobiales bacterium]
MALGSEPTAAARHTPASAPVVVTPETTLHHEPALDGLRGAAVAVVVMFHLGRLDGGFLGVDLFFVLSGFLITSLLVTEHRRRRAVDLGRFWARRARRLLPALALLLVGVALLLLAFTAAGERPRFRGDALATLGYVANWHRMAADVSYWEIFSQPSPLDHTWSLAIEEQFYLVWPLVVVAVLSGWGRRPGRAGGARALGVVAVVGAAASFGLLALTYSPLDTDRAYFATDTRIGATLLGAALATLAARRARRSGAPPAAVEGLGVIALVWMAWSVVTVDGLAPWYYRGGLALFALAALVVIHAATGGPPGYLARGLSWRPLRWLGTVSYGVYLWHWPVIVYATEDRVGIGGWRLDVGRVALTLATAAASYRLVEQPIRRGARRGRTVWLATAGGSAVLVVAILVATGGTVTTPAGPDAVAASAGPAAATSAAPAAPGAPEWQYSFYPDEIPPGARRLLLVGDSGPVFLGPALATEAERTGGFAVAMSSELDCSPVSVEGKVRFPDGKVLNRPVCHDQRRERWRAFVERFDPDAVVYYLANAGGVGEVLLDGEWVTDCDPAFDEHMAETVIEDADVLGGKGARVVLATSPYVGFSSSASAPQVDCRNETIRRVAERRPGTDILDMNAFVEHEADATGAHSLRDLVHLSDEMAARVGRWMLPAVADILDGST